METNQNKLQTSNVMTINCFLASNMLAQFSRQIVAQILGMASPIVCGNLAIYPLFLRCPFLLFSMTATKKCKKVDKGRQGKKPSQ
jgi:hypothetical protein